MLDDLVLKRKYIQGNLAQMTIHQKIKSGREAKGWSMEELASQISNEEGLAKPLAWQTVQQWENGTTAPKRKRLEIVAKLLSLSVSELLGGGTEDSADDEFVKIRRADVRFSNGHGTVIYGVDDMPPLSFRADFLRKLGIAQGKAVVVEADGISNEPRIVDGSVVLVDTGDRDTERLSGDHFYAFRADGHLLIKRLENIKGVGILATAENPNFKPKVKLYREGVDDFEVIGRARWTGAML